MGSDKDKAPMPATPAGDDNELARLLAVPHDDVVIRSVRGPDGIDPLLGAVKMGRIYTIDFPTAVRYCEGPEPRFEPILKADRTRIEAASKQAADRAAEIERKKKELAVMESAK
mgnify:CR=1 FL=1